MQPARAPYQGLLTASQTTTGVPVGAPATTPAAGPEPTLTAQPFADAVLRLVSQQGGLAPLYADIETALDRADLPQAVRTAAQALLTLRVGVPDAAALRTALLTSGLFNEAMLANGMTPAADLKSALLSLRSALQAWLGSARPQSPASPLAPPYRGAAPIAQQPAMPSVDGLDLAATGARLMAETDAALARHVLLQIASLPDAAGPPQQADPSARLTFDIALATPQGTAVIQLQVERDGKDETADTETEAPVWRINLAVDIEPLGPVRASIAQAGGQTHVAFSAARRDAASALRDNLPALQAALSAAALEPGDLVCRSGMPHAAPAGAGLFLDRNS
jgi:hypothetical protein